MMLTDCDLKLKFEALNQRHPHLLSKSLIDLVNGVDVARDHLRVIERNQESFFKRFLGAITGETQARMSRVSAMLIDGMATTTDWLEEIEVEIKDSNLAITKINSRIAKIVDHIHGLQQRLDVENRELYKTIQAVSSRFDHRLGEIEKRMMTVEFRQSGVQHISLVKNRWSHHSFYNLPPILVAVSTVSELFWGDFGNCLRAVQSGRVYNEMLENARYEIAELVARAGDTSVNQLSNRDAVFGPLDKIPVLELEAVQFLAATNCVENTPLLNLVVDQSEPSETLPMVFSSSGLTNLVFLEMQRSTRTT